VEVGDAIAVGLAEAVDVGVGVGVNLEEGVGVDVGVWGAPKSPFINIGSQKGSRLSDTQGGHPGEHLTA